MIYTFVYLREHIETRRVSSGEYTVNALTEHAALHDFLLKLNIWNKGAHWKYWARDTNPARINYRNANGDLAAFTR